MRRIAYYCLIKKIVYIPSSSATSFYVSLVKQIRRERERGEEMRKEQQQENLSARTNHITIYCIDNIFYFRVHHVVFKFRVARLFRTDASLIDCCTFLCINFNPYFLCLVIHFAPFCRRRRRCRVCFISCRNYDDDGFVTHTHRHALIHTNTLSLGMHVSTISEICLHLIPFMVFICQII